MSEEEAEMLPFGFLKKFGSFITKLEEDQALMKTEESQAFEDRWNKAKDLKYIQTQAENEADQELIR